MDAGVGHGKSGGQPGAPGNTSGEGGSGPDAAGGETDRAGQPPRTIGKLWGKLPAVIKYFGLAIFFGLLTWIIFPKEADVATPPYVSIEIQYSGPQSLEIFYQVSSDGTTDAVLVGAEDDQDLSVTPPAVSVQVFFPAGIKPTQACPPPYCGLSSAGEYYWIARLKLEPASDPARYSANAVFQFAGSFGYAANGARAVVSFPQVTYSGSPTADLSINYAFPSVTTYDWAQSPEIESSEYGEASWTEQLLPNQEAASQAVSGVNLSRQRRDNDFTFLAGALVGVAGLDFPGRPQEALAHGVRRHPGSVEGS